MKNSILLLNLYIIIANRLLESILLMQNMFRSLLSYYFGKDTTCCKDAVRDCPYLKNNPYNSSGKLHPISSKGSGLKS